MQQAQKKQNGVLLKDRLTFFNRTRAQHPGSLAVLVEDPKRVIVAVTNRLVVGKARGGNLA